MRTEGPKTGDADLVQWMLTAMLGTPGLRPVDLLGHLLNWTILHGMSPN